MASFRSVTIASGHRLHASSNQLFQKAISIAIWNDADAANSMQTTQIQEKTSFDQNAFRSSPTI